jgi:serine phosphatase RsbU (regulator of sigma subunit)
MFAGAKRPLFYLKNTGELEVIKGTGKSIGGKNPRQNFDNFELTLQKGEILYLSSDGFTDQCNPNRENFGTLRFKETLLELAKQDFALHGEVLNQYLVDFQQNELQRDDITILGVKI